MGGFRYPSFTFQVSGPSALQRVKNWCHEFKSKGGRGECPLWSQPILDPAPWSDPFHLGCVQVDLSCSCVSQELFRQARQSSTEAPLDLSLLAVTKWALGGESAEVHLIAVKHLANHLLTWTLSPWEAFERWCCYHPTLHGPLLPHSSYILKGTLVRANVIHVTQWNRIGHWSNYFRFRHLLFPLSYYLGSCQRTNLLFPLHSGLSAGSRTSLPSASRSV